MRFNVWVKVTFRFGFPLVEQLREGAYQLREQRRVTARGEVKKIWAAQDALVLKALAIALGEELQPTSHPDAFQKAGTGRLKGAVREVAPHLHKHEFVFRPDVKDYYASIKHEILLNLVRQYGAGCVGFGGAVRQAVCLRWRDIYVQSELQSWSLLNSGESHLLM